MEGLATTEAADALTNLEMNHAMGPVDFPNSI
jgi:hypothetical protein